MPVEQQDMQAISRHHALPYKVYLRVPFAEKDRAKKLGARWDAQIRAWYVPPGNALRNFARWLSPDHAALKRSFEALEAAERAREEWFALPPRDLSSREMLSLLDRRPVKRSGFCGMCDSHASNEWCLEVPGLPRAVCHVGHIIEQVDGPLRPSEWKLLLRALEERTV